MSSGSAAAVAAVEIKEITSPGGINAWLVEEPTIPFVALEIRIRGGASLDLPGKRGATNLMMGLIEEGAGDMNAQAFQTRREELAASFRFRAGDDLASISAEFLTENQDEALALLREALINPRFDQDAIDRVRAQVLSGTMSVASTCVGTPLYLAPELCEGKEYQDKVRARARVRVRVRVRVRAP